MNGNIQLLVFSLDDRLFALHLAQVYRVIHAVDATPLPDAPETVLGMIDVQGELIPLFNTRLRFNFPNREVALEDQFIIAKTDKRTVSLFVDKVKGVVERPAGEIVAAKKILGGLDQIDGVIQLKDGPTLIHDLDRFLSPDEEQTLSQALAMEVRA